jgi:hypothetical protein
MDTKEKIITVTAERLRQLFKGYVSLGDGTGLMLDYKLALPIVRQILNDVEREQREKDQAQQDPDSGSALS